MKNSDLKKRLRKNRPMTAVTIRMPKDVLEDLKRVAPQIGFSGYQPLIRAYIGHGLRQDLERLESPDLGRFLESLRKHGIEESVISEVLAEARIA